MEMVRNVTHGAGRAGVDRRTLGDNQADRTQEFRSASVPGGGAGVHVRPSHALCRPRCVCLDTLQPLFSSTV